ncbi:MAG: hypothetical protein Q9160_008745 [Pyrenula sp. 1 TL-2023]
MQPAVVEGRSSPISNGDLNEELASNESETDTEDMDTDDDLLSSDSPSLTNPSPPQTTSYPRYRLNAREQIRVEASLDIQQRRRLIESRLNAADQNEIEDAALQEFTGIDHVDDTIRAAARATLWDAFRNQHSLYDHSPPIYLEDFYPDRDPTIPPRDFIDSFEIAPSDPTDQIFNSRDSHDLVELAEDEHDSSIDLRSYLTDVEINPVQYPPQANPALPRVLPRLRPRRQIGRNPLRPRRSEEATQSNAQPQCRLRTSINANHRNAASSTRTSPPTQPPWAPTGIHSDCHLFHHSPPRQPQILTRSHHRTLGLIPGETPLHDDTDTDIDTIDPSWPDSPTPPPSPHHPTSSSRTCPICLETISFARVSCARCEASFHVACLREWAASNRTCPMCRGWFSGRAVRGGKGRRVLEVREREGEKGEREREGRRWRPAPGRVRRRR